MPIPRTLLRDILSRPYRLAMGLRGLDLADWLVVTEECAAETALKRRLLADGADILRVLPEGRGPAEEAAALVEAHLARHHPDLESDPRVADPFVRAALVVQEDLCLMMPSDDGYRLVAAFVAFPSRWSLAEKIGRPIRMIHSPVPGLEAAIGGPIGTFLDRLDIARPVWRANWSMTDDPTLHQPSNAFRRTTTPVDADHAGEQLFLRVERQTLRRLPKTKAVLFTILTFVERLDGIVAEPGLARDLAARLAELPEPMLAYKNLHTKRAAVLQHIERRVETADAS